MTIGKTSDEVRASADDRDEIVELLGRYASMPDTKDWEELPRTVFADEVTWDFQSLSGRPPAHLSRSELVARLRVTFAGLAATHHAITNHRVTVDGDTAHIRAHI